MKPDSLTDINIKNISYRILLLVTALVLCIYGQTVFFGYSLDDHLIREGIPLRSDGLEGLVQLLKQRYNVTDYRPVVTISYALENWIIGTPNPGFSHAVNLFIYLLIILFVFKQIQAFCSDAAIRLSAYFALLLFSVHPVHVEVVCSLKNRDNLLSMLFAAASVWLFLRYEFRDRHLKYLIFSLVLYLIAVFSKLDAFACLLLFPFIHLVFHPKSYKKAVLYFLLYTLSLFFIRNVLVNLLLPVETIPDYFGTTYTENPLSSESSFGDKIAAAALTFWYYLKLLIIPVGYKYYYGYDFIRLYSMSQWQSILAITGSIVLAIVVLLTQRKNKLLLISSAGFVFFIAYALNFLNSVAGIIADRYIFISSVFFCAYFSFLFFSFKRNKKLQLLLMSTILIVFTAASIYRCSAWENKLSLIERDAPSLHKSYEAMRIAASTYLEYADIETNPETASLLIDKSIDCAVKGNTVYPKNTVLYKLLGTAYLKKGMPGNAKIAFLTAAKNDSADVESRQFTADVYYLENNPDSALYYYFAAYSLDQKNSQLINNISTVLYEKGDKSGSIKFNLELLQKDSTVFAAWENLGYYHLVEKDTATAIYYFRKAVQNGLVNTEISKLLNSEK
jgi:protein O-mannosyl-transferase